MINAATALAADQAAASLSRKAVRIEAANSHQFVAEVFRQQAAGRIVIVQKPGSTSTVLPDATMMVLGAASTGWGSAGVVPLDTSDIVQVMFSSGTTGEPKAIALSGRNIADSVRRLNKAMSLDETVREYVGVPAHYSFGLGRIRAVAAAGGQYYLPPNGFDPSEIAAMLGRGEINAISAVPTLWRLLLQNHQLVGETGASLKWLEIGSQAMSRAEKEQLKRLFPNAIAVQHYGLTEASRTTFLKLHEENGDALDSVGRVEDGVEIKLAADGRIAIRGAHIAPFELTEQGRRILIDDDGWLVTNDIGTLRDGLLHIEGRADDLINCGGVKLFPDALEEHIRQSLGVSGGVAVARIPHPVRGDGILVAFSDPELAEDTVRAAAARAAAAFDLQAAGAISVTRLLQIPVTDTGKVRRAVMARDYLAGAPQTDAAPAVAPLNLQTALVGLWSRELGANVSPNDGFLDLGGDALAASSLVPKMVSLGVAPLAARGVFEGFSIAEIVGAMKAGDDDDQALEAQILGIWREILGRADVGANESFYDVGGDSISAVMVALSMEQSGFDPQLAHGIFDGMTVAELARTVAEQRRAEQGSGVSVPKIRVKTEIAVFSEASNFIKGLILLCMVSSHWIPVYLDVIGKRHGTLFEALAPFFSLGTPTLAFVFGMGITVFWLRQFEKSRQSFFKNIRTSFVLLAGGLLIGSGVGVLASDMVGVPATLKGFALSLTEGPFVYYTIATLSMPVWIRFLRRGKLTPIVLMAAAAALYGLYLWLEGVMPAINDGDPGLNQLAIGHWSVPQLGAVSLMGAAIGLLIDRSLHSKGSLRPLIGYGAAMIAAGLGLSFLFGDQATWIVFPKHVTMWGVLAYPGLALMILGAFQPVAAKLECYGSTRLLLQVVSCIGILLFPLYVLQSLVYESSTIVATLSGIPLFQGLTLCIAAFVALAAYPLWRVFKLYYGRRG